ncbi:MAG: nucleotide exchange factor GrpE [Desulfobacteraceae bacterium]|nr:nucleotide exchange factor GrpE [Desulfobacteraceae bacterium]MCF8094067.1 nucleotide exchange factor GrpE [Desulfobacteraceae bacterium]
MMQEEDNEEQEPEDEFEVSLEFNEKNGSEKSLMAAVDDLRAQMRSLAGEFETKLKYDEHKNRIIDGLHQELQEYREGLIKKHFHSMITDAIKIIDDIRKFKAHYEDDPPSEETLPSLLGFLEDIASDIEDLFSWQGVTPFTCNTEHFDNARQRVVKKVETHDPEMDKKVAGSLRPGYEWEGKVLRPEMVAVYVYINATGKEGNTY